ncbi:MAG: hypothetical protein H6557_30755 [Lewinellaceae bacterium]|nr:hypothetical protein [Phaeodactylibacter sp.]MCB9041030.1 hypothetical protein [Lewinellaceae bacterium]
MSSAKFRIILGILLLRIIPINVEAQALEIWEIQGAGAESPYEFEVVTTEENIVTAKGDGFIFLQCPPERSDNNPLTSDGILANTAYSGQVGDVVTVTGRVLETDGTTSFSSSNITVTFVSSGATLPAPAALGENFPSAEPSAVHSLEAVENMLVQFSATASGPTTNLELTPLATSGQRPFREPGILYPGLPGLPAWDGNPEVFWFDPNGLNAPNNRFINTGARVDATAVMLEAGPGFWLALPVSYTVSGSSVLRPVRDPLPGEFTVGSLNVLRLFGNTPTTNLRLQKLARYIDRQLRLPDILALQEVGSLAVLQDLAYYIELEAPGTRYEAYMVPGGGEINLGFLAKPFIEEVQLSQLGANEGFSLGGRLHDRPPLLLEGTLPTSPPTPIRVLNLHLRSLLGIEGPDATFVRTKRHQQAISVANMVQARQQPAGNLIVVGDFNAFQFSDGYVDVTNQIAGGPSLGAQFPPLPIVSPPLANQAEWLPAEERYSYVFDGNAQILDQCLVSTLNGLQPKGMQYGRGNADNALAYADNPFLAERASDHDGLVLFLETENTVNATWPSTEEGILVQFAQPIPAGGSIYLRSRDSGQLKSIELYTLQGQQAWRRPLSGKEASLQLPAPISGGKTYFLRVEGERGARVMKLMVE